MAQGALKVLNAMLVLASVAQLLAEVNNLANKNIKPAILGLGLGPKYKGGGCLFEGFICGMPFIVWCWISTVRMCYV